MAANFIDLARTSVEQGLLFGLVALALTLTFRVVRFPDLTVDGSFVTGASVFSAGAFYYHAPWLAIPCAFIAGMLAGLTTGVLSSTLRINRLLSGILVMTMLYSINLRIMRQGNLSLAGVPTPLDQMDEWLGSTSYASIAILGFLALASALLIGRLLGTEAGLFFRATGQNPHLVETLGRRPEFFVIVSLAISNGLIGLAGAFAAQEFGFADVNMGIGLIVSGLAMLFIGMSLIPRGGIAYMLAGALVGAVVFQFLKNIALRMGLAATDVKVVSAILVIAALAIRRIRSADASPHEVMDLEKR